MIFALPGALAYGIGDFAGGLATRRAPVLVVTAVAQLVGLVLLLPGLALLPGRASTAAFVVGAAAGVAGTLGLLLYFRALAVGPMGVVAPLSGVVGAGIPLVVGVIGGERPGLLTLVAIVIALTAVVLATAGPRRGPAGRGPLLGLAAGAGFGLFFVGLDATPDDSGLWPLVAGRVVGVLLLGALILARRTPWSVHPLMVVSGLGDSAANVLFLLATRYGDLGVSAVVVSLYPVVVVVLARLVLGERLTRLQWSSAGLALGASVLLAISS